MSLLNSGETMRMIINNFVGKTKLKYDDIRDLILVEEVRKKILVNSWVRDLP